MNEMQFSRTVYKINLYGKAYEMRKPTVEEAVAFQKEVADSKKDEDKLDRLTGFFVSLGLDKEAVDGMQLDHMIQLSEVLSAVDKKIEEFAYKKAMMAYFYGWTDDYMMSMLADTFQDYWLALQVIESQMSLISIRNNAYVNLNKKDRDSIHRDLNKKAKSIISTPNERELSTEEAAKELARVMMNGR